MRPFIPNLNGYSIHVNNYIQPEIKWVQFKFPKSKKKRIRNKWSKNKLNFKLKSYSNVILWDNKIFVNQETYNNLTNYETNTKQRSPQP